jgi:choline dehydrogenase-like flavoprotein
MNLDRMRSYASSDPVDAVVIGTGAGGSPLLARLAAAGRKVVALEAGQNHDPESFPADELSASGIYWLGERLIAGATPQAFGGNNSGMGVGGSTLHWGAFCPRADPRDFRLHTEQGVGFDWPFAYEELLPFYRRVEAFIGVSGPARYPWDSTREYPLPPVKRNAAAQLMQSACDFLQIRATDAPAAVVSRDFVQSGNCTRPGCINCGYCHQGCRIGAKSSMDVTYLPQAVLHGAEIRPGAMAHHFEFNDTGAISAVIYRKDGADHRQRCGAVFLCGGAIETPRLLLHTGVANSSGQVGRNYMAHAATQVWGTFEQETRPNKGYPSSLITEDFVRPDDADFAGGYLVQSLGIVLGTWAEAATRGRALWGAPLLRYLERYNHVAGLGINGECLPQLDNFLELAGEVDAFGIPKARIQFSAGSNESALIRHATRTMTRMWEAAGATDIWTSRRSAHTIGTCRMGGDASTNVVNGIGRSFDISNLWICDNSVFPSALAANPALTIMALSLRTAEAFLAGG